MTTVEQFLWGFIGSIAAEVVTVFRILQQAEGKPRLPLRYCSTLYWVVRITLAAIGGGLVIAYDIEHILLALNIGSTTPLIIDALTHGYPTPQPAAPP